MINCYVDDNKVSHADEKVKKMIIEPIEEHFGELTVSRGRKNKFLGMNIKCLGNGRVLVFVRYYIDKSISQLEKALNAKASSPDKKV